MDNELAVFCNLCFVTHGSTATQRTRRQGKHFSYARVLSSSVLPFFGAPPKGTSTSSLNLSGEVWSNVTLQINTHGCL